MDSKLPSRFAASLGFSRGRYVYRERYAAVVVHTTGMGVIKRFERQGARKGDRSYMDTAVRIYQRIMTAGPHYVIDQLGDIVQVCPEDLAAHHVGSFGQWHYGRKRWARKRERWWHQRWPDHDSPRDLATGRLWLGRSCNANTLGIEVIPSDLGASVGWTPECWSSLARLVEDICVRRGLPIDREHVITHSDAHPRARTTRRGEPWDTSPRQFSWARLQDARAKNFAADEDGRAE